MNGAVYFPEQHFIRFIIRLIIITQNKLQNTRKLTQHV